MAKLTINNLKSEIKNNFKSEEIVVTTNTGKEFTVKIEKNIRDSKMNNIVSELGELAQFCLDNNIKFEIMSTIYMLILKHLTDIPFSDIPNLKDRYSINLEMFANIIDLDLFEQIISNFQQESVDKICMSFDKYRHGMKLAEDVVIKQAIYEE